MYLRVFSRMFDTRNSRHCSNIPSSSVSTLGSRIDKESMIPLTKWESAKLPVRSLTESLRSVSSLSVRGFDNSPVISSGISSLRWMSLGMRP